MTNKNINHGVVFSGGNVHFGDNIFTKDDYDTNHFYPSVYLDKFDINEHGNLPLETNRNLEATYKAYKLYFFYYTVLAKRVYAQGSAPLKNKIIFNLYNQFSDCFKWSDDADRTPLVSFALRENCSGYYEYLMLRQEELLKNKAANNVEYYHYKANNSKQSAIKLDKVLINTSFLRRKHSVDKFFRHSVALNFLDDEFCKLYSVDDDTREKALHLSSNFELFQTYKLINELKLINNKKVAHSIRESYFIANAKAVESHTTLPSETHFFNYRNVRSFLNAIGLSNRKTLDNTIDCSIIFKIRNLKSFKLLKNIYFCQHTLNDLNHFIREIYKLKYGKLFTPNFEKIGLKTSDILSTLNIFHEDLKRINFI
ncbi:hypothetical protein [Thiofilum flexile]|uniref:hypothetical protein n=1 Tax=Thiofilum flexile TaxID=125627 RepID=UPI000375E544|nr:hypothetical protein [Thiofilum flexile]